MIPVVWTENACDDFVTVIEFIASRDAAAAERLLEIIQHTIEQIAERPFTYRTGRVAHTREAIIHPNYVLVYHIGTTEIDMLGVMHTRMPYPNQTTAS